MKKFNIGDSIVFKGMLGSILDVEWEDACQGYIYRISQPFSSYLWVMENQISKYTVSGCDCGAKFDREFPDIHMQFCSVNKNKVDTSAGIKFAIGDKVWFQYPGGKLYCLEILNIKLGTDPGNEGIWIHQAYLSEPINSYTWLMGKDLVKA